MTVKVKICGITNEEDARACVDLGADAIGINLVPESVRAVSRDEARSIASAVRGRTLIVAVVADLSLDELRSIREDVDCLQLHGNETPEALVPLLPHAYKAVRIATEDDARRAAQFPGEYILADAKVTGMLGGTGHTFDWSLVHDLASTRKLTLAGGLRPENVRDAVEAVAPYAVDVASGVEVSGDPRRKDLERVRAFVKSAKLR